MTSEGYVKSVSPKEDPSSARLVTELNTARRVLSMYPENHAQPALAMDRVMAALSACMDADAAWTLSLSENGLSANGRELGRNVPGAMLFAGLMNRMEISGFTIRGRDCRNDLAAFLFWIGSSPESRGEAPEAETIQIHRMRFDRFSVSHEERVARQDPASVKKRKQEVWGAFVTHLESGPLGDEGMSPFQMASAIRNGWLAHHTIAGAIVSTISDMGERMEPPDAAVWDEMLRAVSFEDRQSVLTEALGMLAEVGDAAVARAEILFRGLSRELIVEWVAHGLSSGKPVSPSLLRLMRQMTEAGMTEHMEPGDKTIVEENLQALLNREKYEEYVDPVYDRQLERISRTAPMPMNVDGLPVMSDAFEEPYTSDRIARILFRQWVHTADAHLYSELGRRMVDLCETLAEAGWFQLPAQWLNTLGKQMHNHPDPAFREMTLDMAGILSTPKWMDLILSIISCRSEHKVDGMMQVVQAIGPAFFPFLAARLEKGDETGRIHALFVAFGPGAAEFLSMKMGGFSGKALAEALSILRKTGSESTVVEKAIIHLKSEDPDVRMAAIGALLHIQHPEGLFSLVSELKSRKPEIRGRALALAGEFKVESVVPALCRQFRKRRFRMAAFEDQARVAEALCAIGDERAIAVFHGFMARRLFLNPGGAARVRHAIYRSLHLFSDRQAVPLMEMGRSSGDPVIEKIAREFFLRKNEEGS